MIGGGNWQPAVVAALGLIAFVVVIVAVRVYLVSDGRAIRAAKRRNRRRPTVVVPMDRKPPADVRRELV